MKLSKQDADLFFELMFALHYYVCSKLNMYPDIKSSVDYEDGPGEMKAEVRKAILDDVDLIDSFVDENPNNFSQENLKIILGWKKFVYGNFYVERLLKKHAILMRDEEVYGVLGILLGFDELIHKSRLPLLINTVLLPFKGRIVYDGLFGAHSVTFGGGVKRRLKDTYMRSKQNNRIIESCDEPCKQKESKKIAAPPSRNLESELKVIADLAKKLKGGQDYPAIYSPAFSLLKASVEFAQLAISEDDDLDDLYTALKKVNRALKKADTVLGYEEY